MNNDIKEGKTPQKHHKNTTQDMNKNLKVDTTSQKQHTGLEQGY